MRKLIIIITLFTTLTIFGKYKTADQLSREIPIVSMPKITQKSSISFKVGRSINDDFTTTYPLTLQYQNYFSKYFGFIIGGAYSIPTDNDLKNSIDDAAENSYVKTELPEYFYNQAYGFLGIIFKPIYGKITFFSEKIIHFDLYITISGGATYSIFYKEINADTKRELKEESKITGSTIFTIGQNYFLTNKLAINIEVMDNMTIGEIKDSLIEQNFSVHLGIQYLF